MPPGAFWAQFSIEQQFFLHLIGQARTAGQEAALLTLAQEVNWTAFMALAEAALYPYLDYCVTTRLPTAPIPDPVRQTLARATRSNAMLHLQRRAVSKTILQALAQQHIPVIVLKGAALAEQVYPQPYRRTMGDLDLLIPGERLTDVLTSLQALGFRAPKHHDQTWYYTHAQAHDPTAVSWPLLCPQTALLVEIHPQLETCQPPFTQSLEQVWARSRATSLDGLPCRVLCPEDCLEHLCIHLAEHHGFEQGFRPLLDILLYLTRYDTTWDWPGFAAAAQQHGTAPWLYLTLHLARHLLGAPIPDAFFTAMPPPQALDAAAALAIEQLWYATHFRVPSGVYTAQATPLRHLPGVLWQRLRTWCQDDLNAWPTPPRMLRMVRSTATYLMQTHVPQLRQAWRNGDLAPARRQRAVQLYHGRSRLRALMSPSTPC
ncbi:MAG: nucleotidyltransferase family protein [Candidatus Tectimicrobiota bacterium]